MSKPQDVKKLCPLIRAPCEGENCMMWRWKSGKEFYKVFFRGKSGDALYPTFKVPTDEIHAYENEPDYCKLGPYPPEGYCGLAGELSSE